MPHLRLLSPTLLLSFALAGCEGDLACGLLDIGSCTPESTEQDSGITESSQEDRTPEADSEEEEEETGDQDTDNGEDTEEDTTEDTAEDTEEDTTEDTEEDTTEDTAEEDPDTGFEAGELEIHVIDVGQGDAVLVLSPDGYSLLIDAGDSGEYASSIAPYLAAIGVVSIDYTLVSHMHADHISGMDEALQAHPEVLASYDHGGSYDSRAFDAYLAAAGERRRTLSAGDSLDLGPSVDLEVLHPSPEAMSDDENDRSIVLKLSYGEFSMLLGGDCESSCEARLHPGEVDVYKVHHHGSDTSSTTRLMGEIRPVAALVSVGEDNRYDHPTESALDRIEAVGAGIYRTDLDGDIEVSTDGAGFTVNGLQPR